jgi:serine/threonine protein phosphatase PrpC
VSMPGAVEEAIVAANDAIFSRAQSNQHLSGMGTTLVALADAGKERLGPQRWR